MGISPSSLRLPGESGDDDKEKEVLNVVETTVGNQIPVTAAPLPHLPYKKKHMSATGERVQTPVPEISDLTG